MGGALAYLTDIEPLEQTGTLTVEEARTELTEMLWEFYTGVIMSAPNEARMFHDEAEVTAGNAKLLTMNAAQAYGHAYVQHPSAIAQVTQNRFSLAAGNYTLTLLGTKGSVSGIHDVVIDGVVQGSFDQYASSDQFNQLFTFAVTILTDGDHLIEFVTTGKNASASFYYCALTKYWLVPA